MKKRVLAVLAVAMLVPALLLTGCSSGAIDASQPIQMATKPMTEQFIIAEMLKAVIEENTDYTVDITKGVGGGTGNIQPAMEKGDYHMYPEYTGTGWQYVLKHTDIPATDELLANLKKEYKETYDFEWICMFGFSDMYGLAVRNEIAEQHGLASYSDLATVSDTLSFGAEPDFYEREDGYDAMCQLYGMDFSSTSDLDIGLKYDAINSAKVDVIDVFTTDGQLSVADVTVLTDDKNYFTGQDCGMVVRADVLAAYPGLQDAMALLEGQVTEQEMAQLNYQVDVDGKEDKAVALEFLQSKGIVA